jgi:lysophospholipase L1-like esterase
MSVRRILCFILVVMAMLALIGLFFPKEGIQLGTVGLKFRSPRDVFVLSGEQVRAPDPEEQLAAMAESFLREKLEALSDSMDYYERFFKESPARIHFPNDDPGMLDLFFETLDSCRIQKRVVRVLHYGDSQIEQDRLSATLRDGLQKMAGGMGVGMIPAIQTIPSRTLRQEFEGNGKRYVLYGPSSLRAPHKRYGPMAAVCEVEDYAYLSVNALKRQNSDLSNQFTNIRLLLGNNSAGFKATLEIKDKYDTKTVEEAGLDLKVISWELDHPENKFSLFLDGSAEIYALLLDGAYGVAVDNIPMRGSSGNVFTGIDGRLLHAAYRAMDVQLFLLEFGGNRVPSIYSREGINNYSKAIGRQIRYLKTLVPGAQVIFIGPADMSCLVDGKMQSYPLLEEFIEGLKKAVLENGAAFWDMFQVMGGQNSMINWVNARPPLAAPDYIHFTKKGADKIAELLSENMALCYSYYQFRKKHNPNDSTRLGLSSLEWVYSDYAEEFEQVIREKLASADSLSEESDNEAILNDFLELLNKNTNNSE